MPVCIVTGSGGLVGSECVRFFADKGFDVIGVDNDMRGYFFGPQASTRPLVESLLHEVHGYRHFYDDIRDAVTMDRIFAVHGNNVKIVIHCAAQPSHDWAAKEPLTDFDINARATLILLEAVRKYCPEAAFIFTSTNKVYGDAPNRLPLIELETRFEPDPAHPYAGNGIDETMSLDASIHSIFGASKVAADIMVQEYGRYFGMNTVCFRGGCLTGPGHAGAELHGFLAYLVKCAVTGSPYTVYGHKGKQVRDNIHSWDLVNMFWQYFQSPRPGEVYNVGGGRHSNCSVLEAIALCEKMTGRPFNWNYNDTPRVGDHVWWISDVSKFKRHYPEWGYTVGLKELIASIAGSMTRHKR